MKYLFHLLIGALLWGCANEEPEHAAIALAALPEAEEKVDLLPLLLNELEKGEWNSSAPYGLRFFHTRKDILKHLTSVKHDSLTYFESTSWDFANYWRVDMQYIPQATPKDTLLLSAYNSDRLFMDMLIVKPLASALRRPISSTPAEVESRSAFVSQQLEALTDKYGKPDAMVADSFYVPLFFGEPPSLYNNGNAYFWFRQSQMITLVDVPLYPAVIYSNAFNKLPSPAHMMVLSNAYVKDMVENLWNVPAPTKADMAIRFSIAMKDHGFLLSWPGGDFNEELPEYNILTDHPYDYFRATLYPTGWRLSGYDISTDTFNDQQLKWNKYILTELEKKQGKPSYQSKDGKLFYWLYNAYIVQYKKTNNEFELNFIQIY